MSDSDTGVGPDGLALYERQRAERIARNDEMMLRLGLPALGSKLRLPTTPAAGGAGGSKNPNSFKPVKRRNPKGKPTPPDPNFDMVLRVRKAVDYTDVADVPKPGPPKFPRVEPANAQLSGVAATGPGTTLETLDSKYEKDPEARERAIRLDALRHTDPVQWNEECKKHWRNIREDRHARRVAKAAKAAAAIQRRETAADELVAIGTTQSAPPAANDEPMCCEPCPVHTTPENDPVAPKKTGIDGKAWRDPTKALRAKRWIDQGIELVCSVADCGTDQTDRWYGSKIETNKPVCRNCYTLQSVVPDRVCGAGCGKGGSDVTKWYHSQRDKNNKDLCFCKSCYDKEALQLAKEAGRTCVSCLAAETTSWHSCDGVPGGWDCALCFNKRDSSKSYNKEYNKGYIRPKKQKKD